MYRRRRPRFGTYIPWRLRSAQRRWTASLLCRLSSITMAYLPITLAARNVSYLLHNVNSFYYQLFFAQPAPRRCLFSTKGREKYRGEAVFSLLPISLRFPFAQSPHGSKKSGLFPQAPAPERSRRAACACRCESSPSAWRGRSGAASCAFRVHRGHTHRGRQSPLAKAEAGCDKLVDLQSMGGTATLE
jgi:hypothetical protein